MIADNAMVNSCRIPSFIFDRGTVRIPCVLPQFFWRHISGSTFYPALSDCSVG